MIRARLLCCLAIAISLWLAACAQAAEPQRLKYNHPGLTVDLGVGLWAWPLPMDYDGDGDTDLVVSCPDKPHNGAYFFENVSGAGAGVLFKPAVRVGRAQRNVQVSYLDGQPRLLIPGAELVDFRANEFAKTKKVYRTPNVHGQPVRANQWKYADYDGDGAWDLIVGVGDWSDYGWDNAFDERGRWIRGPLHGYVYLLRNRGDNLQPDYEQPRRLQAGGRDVDVFGMPSPNLADFDGDGDLDLLCGEFLDGFTYFENTGTRKAPRYAAGRRLQSGGTPIRMDLQMIVPVAFDWDRDGDVDLIVGDEDGRVALIEHTGKVVGGQPEFRQPKYFQQQADEVKFGALVTPVGFDWDGDGDEDLICGTSAGYIGFIENLGGAPPRWAAPVRLRADGKTIRIQAGENGSIQGPCEAKWGYTTLSVADWDHDGLPDIVANSIWGKVVWFRNLGPRERPKLAAAQPVRVSWTDKPPQPAWNWWSPENGELATQWRTTPCVLDLTGDGLNDLAMLDHEGYLVLFERRKTAAGLTLAPPRRVFRASGPAAFDNRHRAQGKEPGLLRLNVGAAGRSGRRKLCFTDWDGDGQLDLLVNSVNVNLLRNVSREQTVSDVAGAMTFQDMGPLFQRELAGHTTSPTVVDWDRDGTPDLLVGAEDGFLYYWPNPRGKKRPPGRSDPAPK